MTVSTYTLAAANGRKVRTATQVTFPDGRVVRFMERMSKREAIRQAAKTCVKVGDKVRIALPNWTGPGCLVYTVEEINGATASLKAPRAAGAADTIERIEWLVGA